MNIYMTQPPVQQATVSRCAFPVIEDNRLLMFCNSVNSSPVHLKISPRPLCEMYQCHKNVNTYISMYGGDRIIGYHFIEYLQTLVGILHSVWENPRGDLDDITRSEHNFSHRLFVKVNSTTTSNLPPSIYFKLQESEIESYKIGSFQQDMKSMDVDEFSF